eukprot:5374272-Amphidinium_carterae.1
MHWSDKRWIVEPGEDQCLPLHEQRPFSSCFSSSSQLPFLTLPKQHPLPHHGPHEPVLVRALEDPCQE